MSLSQMAARRHLALLMFSVLAASAARAAPPPDKAQRTDRYGDPLPPGALVRIGTLRFRNSDCIGPIAFSPDGKLLAAGAYGSGVLLYEAATGRRLRQLKVLMSQFAALTFAPDGKTLAVADSQTIQIWDVDAGKELRRFGVQASQTSDDYGFRKIVPLVYSHDGKTLAWVAADRSVRLWEVKSGKELAKLSGHQKPIHCLVFSADDKKLISVSDEFGRAGSVRVWHVSGGKEIRKVPFPSQRTVFDPEPLCFSPDGKTLAFATLEVRQVKQGKRILAFQDKGITLLDLETGEVRRKLEPRPGGRFKVAAFSPDGKILAAMNGVPTTVGHHHSEDNNRIHVWDTATGKPLWDVPAYAEHLSQGPCSLAFSPDGKKLAAASTASSLHVWDVARGHEDPEQTETHHDNINCVVFSPDGKTLASGSADHTIALWDAVTGKLRLRLRGHEDTVLALAFSPDGKRLASASRFSDQTVRLWDLTTGKELRQYLVPHMAEGNGLFMSVDTWVAFAANGKILATGGTDRKIRLWDVATGKELLNQQVRGLPDRPRRAEDAWKEHVQNVAFTPDGRLMALSTGSQMVHVADVVSGQRLFPFEEKDNTTAHLFFSPDGKTLACGGRSNSFRLVEIASGKDLHKIDLDLPVGDEVLAVAFAPDGRTVAVAAGHYRGWIYLFDVATGKQLLRLTGAASYVHSLAFAPDGNTLASAQNDSTALVWDVTAARCKLPVTNLTAGELERLWTELRDADAVKAHAALWTLVAAPDKAVPFLNEHLHAVPCVAPARLRRWIADLDADDFTRREEASRELAKLGSEVEPALRQTLAGKPTLETRRRIEALLNDLVCQTAMTPEALRQLRAIQVLEQIGSMEARQILSALAQGAPAAPATRDAKAALERLRRSATP